MLKHVEEFDDNDTDHLFCNELSGYDDRSGNSWSRIRKGHDLKWLGDPVLLYKSDFADDFDYYEPEELAKKVKDDSLRKRMEGKDGFYHVISDHPMRGEGEGFMVLVWIGKDVDFLVKLVAERKKRQELDGFAQYAKSLMSKHGLQLSDLQQILNDALVEHIQKA